MAVFIQGQFLNCVIKDHFLFINIHSHQPPAAQEWCIQNLYNGFDRAELPGHYSIGIHPWYIEAANWLQQMDTLRDWCHHPHVLAIGECGLDKVCTTSFSLQQQVFLAQLQIANEVGKPLIIHCVRAWEEVLHLLQQQQNRVPVIFHGFNKNIAIAQRIINKGYYLSFGKSLEKMAIREVLAALPPDKIFLETDAAAVTIESIYKWAADAFSIEINSLLLQIQKNAATVFGAALVQL